jgi:hypothetical protein
MLIVAVTVTLGEVGVAEAATAALEAEAAEVAAVLIVEAQERCSTTPSISQPTNLWANSRAARP